MVTQEQLIKINDLTGFAPDADGTQSEMVHRMAKTWSGDTRWERGQCLVCSTPIFGGEHEEFPVTVCAACESIVDMHYEIASQSGPASGPAWEDECPTLYRDMISGHITPHNVDEKAMDRVTSWSPGHRTGLILIGNSGTGKTLALWTLKRKLMQSGIRCDFYSAVEVARELSRHAKDLEAAIHLWKTRVLMIDDLGKEPVTPAASALFWELIDRRYQNQVPTIITTRYRGEQFAARFREPALGTDIRRRMKDTCVPIAFEGGQS